MAKLDELPPDEVVWKFPFSVAILGPWQSYHGYCILVSRIHATELNQLGDEERLTFLDEMCLLAKAIEDCFHPKKLNYEMLGNQTPHMHWHVIPRYQNDTDFAHPIWLAIDRVKEDKAARQKLKTGPTDNLKTASLLRLRLQAIAPGTP